MVNGDDDHAGEEIDEGQRQDEELRRRLVADAAEDEKDQAVAHGTDYGEKGENREQGDHLPWYRRLHGDFFFHHACDVGDFLLDSVLCLQTHRAKNKVFM